MASENVAVLTDANFKSVVSEADKPVLVDFWASWCGPCRMIAPVIDEIANEFAGKVVVGKLNVDENRQIPSEYNVMSIPTLVLIKGGQIVDKAVGYKSKQELAAMIEKAL
ncbi:thioredoxin [Heliophilum fasciatum]|uniref:Thioredoxin n=1 Tax=Heliophilum fasciatum TaxID=35700 RepID=A0A4R2RNQ8_9FIRM|nr:thioredoxin [Heliophilum fasciatum]MCW2278051.1 thioredoxin 1 [Heliophilum fasciatum]TCP64329.1 thioredoxin [Heliophilum fasciatum]